MKKIYNMLLLAVLSMTMFSCSDWDSPYYIEDIVGSWLSYYGHDGYGEYDILGYDQVRFDFYSNYTGRYTYYSYYGLRDLYFDWNTYGDRLVIHYEDGTSEYLFYGFDRNGDLILATDSRFYQYTAYRPVGMYYEMAKDMPDNSLSKAPSKVESNAAGIPEGPRATKARADLKEK
jgi:hypothetical protein